MAVSTRALPAAEAPFDRCEARHGQFRGVFRGATNEVTPEKNLPKGKPGGCRRVFTLYIVRGSGAEPGASYGQIGQEVLRSAATKHLATTTCCLRVIWTCGIRGRHNREWHSGRGRLRGRVSIAAGLCMGWRQAMFWQ